MLWIYFPQVQLNCALCNYFKILGTYPSDTWGWFELLAQSKKWFSSLYVAFWVGNKFVLYTIRIFCFILLLLLLNGVRFYLVDHFFSKYQSGKIKIKKKKRKIVIIKTYLSTEGCYVPRCLTWLESVLL